jgi:catechol 2,3-dioxygenase-like lactoylglutathione lyase family enzyme
VKAYVVRMTTVVRRTIAATYVRDIDTSRAFYELLGFREVRAGKAATSAWSVLRHGQHAVLLTSTRPRLKVPPLPLLFYFFVEDLDAVLSILGAAGVETVQLGCPPHAPGGEAKVTDPDGNTVLLGQEERSPSQPPTAEEDAHSTFSLLTEAAAAVAARGGTTEACQVTTMAGLACAKQAEIKLADGAGDTVWACLTHADEILVTVPGAFIASQGGQGLAHFLSHRHRRD